MIAFAGQVTQRGGVALEPSEYKRQFLDRLFTVSGVRLQQLRDGSCAPDQYLVPGSRAILEDLRARGMRLYLASGTDDAHLKEEAALLDITRYFDGGVYGALPDPEAFSKRMLIEQILRLPSIRPRHLIGFGDGPVEIEETETRRRPRGGTGDGRARMPRDQPVEASQPDRGGRRLHRSQFSLPAGSAADAICRP